MYVLSRLRVALNRVAMKVLNLPKPFAFVGEGSSLALCRTIAASGVGRVTVVTDKPLLGLGLVDPIIDSLRTSGLSVDVFAEVEPDPGYDSVLAGVEHLRRSRSQAILAIGGGSSIDCAKAIVLSHANDCHPSRLIGVWLYAWPRKNGLPFYAIPTTAGTGSEVTIAAVVSDKAARSKAAIIDPRTAPRMVALDPNLTLALPPFITACTGMDALTHAVEAYISSMATPETDAMARTATAMILRNLPVAYRNPDNVQARSDMLIASCLAGMAFTRTGVGYVHAVAHQLGGLYHVPHGLANAIVLPLVLDYSKSACATRLAELARTAGLGSMGMNTAELADELIAHIRRMNADMGIPPTVEALQREDFDIIVDRMFSEAHGTYGVPRYMRRGDAQVLLLAMLACNSPAANHTSSSQGGVTCTTERY